jgi:hypothetical protein
MQVLLLWSSGRVSAWVLDTLRRDGINVVGSLTTLKEVAGRVSMQGIRQLVGRHLAADPRQAALNPPPNPGRCSTVVLSTGPRGVGQVGVG